MGDLGTGDIVVGLSPASLGAQSLLFFFQGKKGSVGQCTLGDKEQEGLCGNSITFPVENSGYNGEASNEREDIFSSVLPMMRYREKGQASGSGVV